MANCSYYGRWLLCRYILIGYALKKVIKIAAVIAGLAYLQHQQIANINWNKLQTISEGAITTLSNAIAQIPGISLSSGDSSHAAAAASSLAMTSFGIPLTCRISVGFTIGFLKG